MKMKETLVTIIVPCYGVDKYLSRCVESILSQTHTSLELILVDDGSPDDSGKIADSFAKRDKRVRVIHKENGGVSTARNAGIDLATGAYICFADGDDWLEPNYIEYLLDLATSTGSDIALSDRIFVSPRDDKNIDYSSNDTTGGIEVLTPEECMQRQFYYKIRTVAVFNKLYKKSLFEDGARFNPNFFMGEGFNFNIRMYKKATKIAVGHRKIYWYFKENSESATSKFSMRHIQNGLASIEDMGSVVDGTDPEVVSSWRYAKHHTMCDFYAGMIKNNKRDEYPVQYREMSSYCRAHLFDALFAPVSMKEKIRPVLFAIIPGVLITKIMSSNIVYRRYLRNRNV